MRSESIRTLLYGMNFLLFAGVCALTALLFLFSKSEATPVDPHEALTQGGIKKPIGVPRERLAVTWGALISEPREAAFAGGGSGTQLNNLFKIKGFEIVISDGDGEIIQEESRVWLEILTTRETVGAKVGQTYEGAKLLQIDWERILFEYGGEEIWLDANSNPFAGGGGSSLDNAELMEGPVASKKSRKVGANHWVIDPVERDRILARLDNIWGNEISTRPAFEGGKMKGVKLLEIDKDSIVRMRGFRKGDVITSVNGQPLDSTTKVAEMVRDPKLRSAKRVTVVLERAGRQVQMIYDIQ